MQATGSREDVLVIGAGAVGLATALALLDEVLDEFIKAREREGAKLATVINERIDGIAAIDHNIALWVFDQEPRNGNVKRLIPLVHLDVFGLGAKDPGLEHMQLDTRGLAPRPLHFLRRSGEYRLRRKGRSRRQRSGSLAVHLDATA